MSQPTIVCTNEAQLPERLCAVANATECGGCDAAVVRFAAPAATRDEEDAARLALDRAFSCLYPALDMRRVQVAPSAAAVDITISKPALVSEGPRFTVAGACFCLGDDGDIVDGDARRGRKLFTKRYKEDIAEARAVLAALYARNTEFRPRKACVSGVGIAVRALVVATDDLNIYLGLFSSSESAIVIGRARLAAGAASAVLQTTTKAAPEWLSNRATAYALQHRRGAVRFARSVSDCALVDIVAHRWGFQQPKGAERPVRGTLEAEDIGMDALPFAQGGDAGLDAVGTEEDVLGVVAQLHADSLAAYYAEGSSVKAAVDLLRNTSEYRHRRAQGTVGMLRKARDALVPLATATKGAELPAREGQQVEFKAHANVARDRRKEELGSAQATTERLRQVMAAMANTHGGAIFVGIDDSGVIVGDAKIAKELRTTSFAPSMLPDAVSVRELPVGAAGAKLNAQWWKAPGGPAAAAAPSAEKESVVTAIRVMAAVAPFHLAGATADSAPMVRGCASTVPLSVTATVERLVADKLESAAKRARDEGEQLP